MTGPSRQERQHAFVPRVGPVDTLLSEDAKAYTGQVPTLQQQAARDPAYNGVDAERRLRGSE